MIIAFFVIKVLLLTYEGATIARLLLKEKASLLSVALGLPLGALINVLVFFILTVTGIALTPVSVVLGHIILVALILLFIFKFIGSMQGSSKITDLNNSTSFPRLLSILCLFVLTSAFLYSFAHAVILPTFHYDSATNWNHRSKISFIEQRMVFEEARALGVNKPTYPFLYHAFQITANTGQSLWNDRMANTVMFLLSWSALGALFLIVRILRGGRRALITVAVITGVPLIAMHFGQQYADSIFVVYGLLGLATLALAIEKKRRGFLLLSALFVTACVWTKSEGLFFCLIPYILTLLLLYRRNFIERNHFLPALALALILSLPWPLFAFVSNLGLTPHGATDFSLMWSAVGWKVAMQTLFLGGSFGLVWYALPITLAFFLRHKENLVHGISQTLLWGNLVLLQVFFIYLFTPNIQYLLSGQSYDRQLMLPIALILLSCALLPKHQGSRS